MGIMNRNHKRWGRMSAETDDNLKFLRSSFVYSKIGLTSIYFCTYLSLHLISQKLSAKCLSNKIELDMALLKLWSTLNNEVHMVGLGNFKVAYWKYSAQIKPLIRASDGIESEHGLPRKLVTQKSSSYTSSVI